MQHARHRPEGMKRAKGAVRSFAHRRNGRLGSARAYHVDPLGDRQYSARPPSGARAGERRRAVGEARVPEPHRVDEGPDGARDDRGRRTGRPFGAWRDGGGVHRGQHGTGGRAPLRRGRRSDTPYEIHPPPRAGGGAPAGARCGAKGYRTRIVISACFSAERMQLMRALGAELDIVPAVERPGRVTARDIQNMIDRAAELAAEPGTYATDQFRNPYVAAGFRDSLGREIREQTAGRVTAFCHGVGTSGSLMGVAEALRSRDPGIRIVALEPAGSPAITGGGPAGSFAMQGWAGSVPPQFDRAAVDDVWTIEDGEAIEMTARLAREEGIFAGVSSGANVVGARRLATELGPDAVVVTLAVDSGFKYMTGQPYAPA